MIQVGEETIQAIKGIRVNKTKEYLDIDVKKKMKKGKLSGIGSFPSLGFVFSFIDFIFI